MPAVIFRWRKAKENYEKQLNEPDSIATSANNTLASRRHDFTDSSNTMTTANSTARERHVTGNRYQQQHRRHHHDNSAFELDDRRMSNEMYSLEDLPRVTSLNDTEVIQIH